MTFSPAYLYALLAADTGVKALVKSGTVFRCYPDTAPVDVKRPYLIYSFVWADKERPAIVDKSKWQIDAYAETKSGAFALSSAVDAALDGISSVMNDGYFIEAMFTRPLVSTYEPETKLYRDTIEVRAVGYLV